MTYLNGNQQKTPYWVESKGETLKKFKSHLDQIKNFVHSWKCWIIDSSSELDSSNELI